jgi:DNA (cytosine-5)-methyltransferase 1
VWRNGNQPNAARRSERAPAPTIHFGHCANQVEWVPGAYDTRQCGARLRPVGEPAPTMLASGLAKGVPVWAAQRPATTVACDPRVCQPGGKKKASSPNAPGRCEGAVRVTTTQAAVLQGFDPRYPWRGPRTRQFDQIGNAVPPPLALAVLAAAIKPSELRPRPSGDNPPPRRQGRAR